MSQSSQENKRLLARILEGQIRLTCLTLWSASTIFTTLKANLLPRTIQQYHERQQLVQKKKKNESKMKNTKQLSSLSPQQFNSFYLGIRNMQSIFTQPHSQYNGDKNFDVQQPFHTKRRSLSKYILQTLQWGQIGGIQFVTTTSWPDLTSSTTVGTSGDYGDNGDFLVMPFFFLAILFEHCAPQQISTSERVSMEFPTSFTVS